MISFGKKIPLAIHPLFWVTAAIIGFLNSGSWIGTLIWIFVILVSVIVHEMGHASTALFFGLKPRIELVALGGLTYHQGDKLPFWKQFLIVLNGPLFGFGLFLLAWGLLKIPALAGPFITNVLTLFFWVNLIWTILNLVPVMPLDGGQLLRIGLEAFFGAKGFRYSLIIGMVVAGSGALFFFLFQNFFIGALFFLFAFQSFDMFRRLRRLSDCDNKSPLKDGLAQAEQQLQSGDKEGALSSFEKIREDSKEGMIHMAATQYVAFLKYEKGDSKAAYDLLKPLRSDLPSDALCLLHKAAYEQKDYALVEETGADCFRAMPAKEVALRNAYAAAALSKSQPAVGWLETAFQEGLDQIQEILKAPEFNPIRDTEHFQKFLKLHS